MKLPDGVTFVRDRSPGKGSFGGTMRFTRMALARAAYNSARAREAFPPRERWRRAWRAARMFR